MSRLDEALERLRSGGVVILSDEEREGEGMLVAAAEVASPDAVRFLTDQGRGAFEIVTPGSSSGVPSPPAQDEGRAPPAATSAGGAVSSDLVDRRLRALRSLVHGDADGTDIAGLGLVMRRGATGGALGRAGWKEGAVDAVTLAGCAPMAALRSVQLPGGLLAPQSALDHFARVSRLPVLTIQDVVAIRLATETIVEHAASAQLPSVYAEGAFEVRAYRSLIDGSEHLAMVHGPLGADPLVRVHSECLTGDALGSLRCDCGDQLRRSLALVAASPSGGAVIYLRGQEGRGIGLVNKIRAYALQDRGRDTVEANVDLGFAADLRDYGVAVQMLQSLGVKRLRLLSNNPRKAMALERYGIAVSERVTLRIEANPYNAAYLDTKRRKFGHDLA